MIDAAVPLDLMAEVQRVRDLIRSEPWGEQELQGYLGDANAALRRGDSESARLHLLQAAQLFELRSAMHEAGEASLTDDQLAAEGETLEDDLLRLAR